MSKFLDETGVSWLIAKIKSTFFSVDDAEQVTLVDVDTIPTQNSTNLVESGGVYSVLSEKEDVSNKVTSISSSSTNDEYPSALCVYNVVGDIETLLASI